MKGIIFTLLFLGSVTSYSQIGYINCSPFPSKCLIVATGYEEAVAWLDKDKLWKDSISTLEENFAGEYSFTTYTDGIEDWPVYIIVFDEILEDDLEGYLTVSHEVLHLMQFLYDNYAVEFTAEIESSAYFFEYLVNETYKIVKQPKK